MGNVAEISFRDETQGREGWPPGEKPRQTTDERLPQASGEYTHLIDTDRDGDRAETLGQAAAEVHLMPSRLFRVIDNILYPRLVFAAKTMERPFVGRRLRLAGAALLTTALLGLNVGGSRDALIDLGQEIKTSLTDTGHATVGDDGMCYFEGDNVGPVAANGDCPLK